jgi:Cys-rich repeat protein
MRVSTVTVAALMVGSCGQVVPVNHRASDVQCSTSPAQGDCSGPKTPTVVCNSDASCAAGTNGRCITEAPLAGCVCTYDTCIQDADCPSGQTCACHESQYIDLDGNRCVPGNCRVDADCGAGGYCSPSPRAGCIFRDYLAGYYCHTAGDLCTNDSDCHFNADTPDTQACAYSTSNARWECVDVGWC